MTAWEQGRATVENLITTGMLERVPPNLSAAQSLVEVAVTHLASALTLAETDTVLAYDALHGANLKALTAILLAQGLRPTRPPCAESADDSTTGTHYREDP